MMVAIPVRGKNVSTTLVDRGKNADAVAATSTAGVSVGATLVDRGKNADAVAATSTARVSVGATLVAMGVRLVGACLIMSRVASRPGKLKLGATMMRNLNSTISLR